MILKSVTKLIATTALVGGFGTMATVSARAQSAVTLAGQNSDLSQWGHLVQLAGLVPAAQSNPVTVFAISDKAFHNMNAVWANALKSPGAMGSPHFMRIQALVMSQAVLGIHPMSEFAGKTVTLTSVGGTPIVIDATNPNKVTVKAAYTTSYVSGEALSSSQAVIYPVYVTKVHP